MDLSPRTVSIECCYQNVGIATSVALTMFAGEELAEAMGVPLLYGLVEAITIGIYCNIVWKLGWTKAPPDVKFWTMISTSYEIIMAEVYELQAIEVSLTEKEDEIEIASSNQATISTFFKWDALWSDDLSHEEDGELYLKEPSGYDLSQIKCNTVREDDKSSDIRNLDVLPGYVGGVFTNLASLR